MTETSHLKVVHSDPCTCDEDYYSKGSKTCPLHGRLKVVPFKPRPCPFKESVLETLKEVLEEAEAGNVNAVVVAVVRPNGAITCNSSEGETVGLMVGALALAQHSLLAATEREEGSDDPDDGGESGTSLIVTAASG